MQCNHWTNTADRPSLQKESCPASWDPPGEGSRSGGAVWVPEALFSSVPGIWRWNAAGGGPHRPGGRRRCWSAENTLPTCCHGHLVVPSVHKPRVSQKVRRDNYRLSRPPLPCSEDGGAGRVVQEAIQLKKLVQIEWSACPDRRWSPDRVKARVKEGKIALKIISEHLSIIYLFIYFFNFPPCLMSRSAGKRLQVRTTVQH